MVLGRIFFKKCGRLRKDLELKNSAYQMPNDTEMERCRQMIAQPLINEEKQET